ncbi:hypothetical protein PVL29_004309 [Vitis rotundifolia]|uniref:DUF642 domain-containing protein n=1 Tax=Vitis rotundifolia TaxID=103349 RepID=A0AA39A8S0_VITRO|nr:hypothetical protein PVL29_004309 [Vitis rotundifolia]
MKAQEQATIVREFRLGQLDFQYPSALFLCPFFLAHIARGQGGVVDRRLVKLYLSNSIGITSTVSPFSLFFSLKLHFNQTLPMRAVAFLLLLLCATCHIALSFTDGLLPNGNFELGPKPSDMKGTEVIGRHAIPEWEISGFIEYIKAGQKQGDMLLVVPEGAFAVRLGNEASIKQRVKVIKGMYYSITFSAARTCAQEERLNISVAPDSGVLPMQTLYSSNGWDSYAWAFQADFDVIEIVIHNPGVEEDPACGPLIDSVAFRALYPPRPSSKNLLKNGGFEEGPYVFPNTSWGVLIPPNIEDDHSPLPGWMVESLKAVKYIDSDHFSFVRII